MTQLERTALHYRMALLLVAMVLVGGLWTWGATHGLAQQIPNSTQVTADGTGTPDGISVQTLTPEVARWLDLPSWTRGVAVSTVDAASPWAKAGLQRADVIQEANGLAVTNEREFRGAIDQPDFEPLLLLVKRGSDEAKVTEVQR